MLDLGDGTWISLCCISIKGWDVDTIKVMHGGIIPPLDGMHIDFSEIIMITPYHCGWGMNYIFPTQGNDAGGPFEFP